MNVNLLLFAAAKEIAGTESLALEVHEPCNVKQLKTALIAHCPELEELTKRSAFSVDQSYATEQTRIASGSEVALIPPVSGG